MPSVSNSQLLPDGTPRISLQPAPSKPFQYEGSVAGLEPIEDYDTETVQMDDGDSCCSDAKDKLARAWAESNNMSPANAQRLRTNLDEMPCDQFRQFMERDDVAQSMISRGNPAGHKVLARDRQILAEWDECASENFSGDFTASADPFEAAWDIMQKQIGRDDFGYSLAVQPHLMSSQFGAMPAELGLRLRGNIPINEALRHLEASQDLESYARTKGFETAEDVGLREEDFDDEWEYYEAMAEMGVGQDPLDFLENEYQYFRPGYAKDMAVNPNTGKISDAEILRVNMEPLGHPNISREAFPPIARDSMINALEQRKDAGATVAPVSTGAISALGQGPMVDVNPAFAGMGLGATTLAGLLENTGRLEENHFSPAGLATLQSLARRLDEAGIEHRLDMDPSVKRPVMDAQQQLRNWQSSSARYPHQGNVRMSIGDGTQLTNQGTPDNVGIITHSINQQLDNEPPSTIDELRQMFDRSKRRRHIMTSSQPPTLLGAFHSPFSAPSFQDRIDWGE